MGYPGVSVRPTLSIPLDEFPDRICKLSYGTPRRGGVQA